MSTNGTCFNCHKFIPIIFLNLFHNYLFIIITLQQVQNFFRSWNPAFPGWNLHASSAYVSGSLGSYSFIHPLFTHLNNPFGVRNVFLIISVHWIIILILASSISLSLLLASCSLLKSAIEIGLSLGASANFSKPYHLYHFRYLSLLFRLCLIGRIDSNHYFPLIQLHHDTPPHMLPASRTHPSQKRFSF